MTHPIVPTRTYVLIFLALMVLTGLTVAAAMFDLGPLNVLVALLIAGVKAGLVTLFFMGIRFSSSLTKLFVASGFVWLIVLIGFTISDYYSRSWLPLNTGW